MHMFDGGIQRGPDILLRGKETVLVVDDFEDVRSFLDTALTMFGYNVICAVDGMDGLDKYIENKDRIHAVMLDVVMPKLNGIELFREIKKLEPDTKVLFMSGYNEIFHMNNLGENKCISKPFNIKTLLKELREILDS